MIEENAFIYFRTQFLSMKKDHSDESDKSYKEIR